MWPDYKPTDDSPSRPNGSVCKAKSLDPGDFQDTVDRVNQSKSPSGLSKIIIKGCSFEQDTRATRRQLSHETLLEEGPVSKSTESVTKPGRLRSGVEPSGNEKCSEQPVPAQQRKV